LRQSVCQFASAPPGTHVCSGVVYLLAQWLALPPLAEVHIAHKFINPVSPAGGNQCTNLETRGDQARGGSARILIDDGQTLSNNATREKLGNERANIFVANGVFK